MSYKHLDTFERTRIEVLSKMGYSIDRKKIELEAPIKSVGEYLVPVRLYVGVVGKINVKVVANA